MPLVFDSLTFFDSLVVADGYRGFSIVRNMSAEVDQRKSNCLCDFSLALWGQTLELAALLPLLPLEL